MHEKVDLNYFFSLIEFRKKKKNYLWLSHVMNRISLNFLKLILNQSLHNTAVKMHDVQIKD